ncbi:MAG: RNA polymerase sigma factor [Bryobacteraceae bacterium]
MAEVGGGDVSRMAVLFERHNRALFRFFLSMCRDRALSEDLVQDVFFRMLRYRHSYDAKQPFTAWMYQIARNAHLDQVQKRKGEVVSFEEYLERRQEPAEPSPGAQDQLERTQDVGLLRRALERLPEEKREILILARFQNLKYEEIAQILDCEVNTVKVRVFRAVKALGVIFHELADQKVS